MLRRKVVARFEGWKKAGERKVLVVTGGRKVGKTFAVRQFIRRHYRNALEINFVTMAGAAAMFDGELDADAIIVALTAFSRQSLVPGKSVIFFDEVQECPRALLAARCLAADGRCDCIASGVLFGVNGAEAEADFASCEVVRVFPLDFEEFCLANGVQGRTFLYVRDCYENRVPVDDDIHQKLMQLFRFYMIVGSMPAVVQQFVDTHDVAKAVQVQHGILELYRQDSNKYAKKDRVRISRILDRIPSELGGKNRRFMLADIDTNARMNRYESSFAWLSNAGVTLPCYNLRELKSPLEANELRNLTRLFLNDTGLLCAMSTGNVQFEILKGNMNINRGSIAENAVAQQLAANGVPLYYFAHKGFGEADFVVQEEDSVVLAKVKPGKDVRRHAALNNVLANEKWRLRGAVVFCAENVAVNGKITYLPLYMATFFGDSSAKIHI